MKQNNCLWIFILMLVTGASWAYGGGSSSSKACAKPKFTDFVPAENAEVAAGSAFSFTASANTYPDSIQVTVKGQPATVNVTPIKAGGFEVKGTLPASLKDTFARITITADAQSKCVGSSGWLLKITK